MKFTVELDDFFMDDEGDGIEKELKDYITGSVVKQIYEHIRKDVNSVIRDVIKERFELQLKESVSSCVSEVVENEFITNRYDNERVSLKEYFKNCFSHPNFSTELSKIASESAKLQAHELKQRYDVGFATSIVSKLHEQGMLKEEVAKLLLTK